MKTRIIHTKIWDDDFFSALSKEAQYFWLYMLTNYRINLCGIYELSNVAILRETKLKARDVLKAREELRPKAFFYRGWVWVVNAQRLGGYIGEKNDIACKRELSLIPEEIIKGLYKQKEDRVSIGDISPIDTSINHKLEIINHKSDSSIDFLKNIPDEVIQDFSEKYNCYENNIREKGEELYDYCLSHGKENKYKDFKAFLRNAVRKDFGKRPPTPKQKEPEIQISEEDRKRNIEKMAEVRNKVVNKLKV